MALGVGVLLVKTARRLDVGWIPVALLAFMPGFGVAMCRVSNDALCALLMSAAVAGALVSDNKGWGPTIGSAAAGLAPWAKLYGLAVLPGSAFREATRRDSPAGRRWIRVLLITAPAIALAIFSFKILGHAIPIMYNIRGAPSASIFDIPWIRSAWTVAKTHIWISGMSFLVFPTWLYLAPLAFLFWGLWLTIVSLRSGTVETSKIVVLAAPLLLFAAALGYQEWRGFSYYGGPGGSGGWYLWSVALPEMLLLTYGAGRRGMIRGWTIPVLASFLVLTVLGDLALFCDAAGILASTANGHIQGVIAAPLSRVVADYADSRPRGAAVASVGFAAISWCVALVFLVRVYASRSPQPTPSSNG
jgi:hypothetical protein